jgi:simple sugar transport system permease protein
MLIAGALSGLAGGIIYLSGANATQIRVQINIPGEGFDGISVALLATNSPIGVIFSAIFINFITQFGSLVEGASTFKKEISDVIIAVIIYFSALSSITLYYLNVRKRKRLKHNSELNKEGDE